LAETCRGNCGIVEVVNLILKVINLDEMLAVPEMHGCKYGVWRTAKPQKRRPSTACNGVCNQAIQAVLYLCISQFLTMAISNLNLFPVSVSDILLWRPLWLVGSAVSQSAEVSAWLAKPAVPAGGRLAGGRRNVSREESGGLTWRRLA